MVQRWSAGLTITRESFPSSSGQPSCVSFLSVWWASLWSEIAAEMDTNGFEWRRVHCETGLGVVVGGCYWLVHTLALSLVLFLNLHLACHILLLTAKTVCLVFTIWINNFFLNVVSFFYFVVVAFINVLCNFNWYFFSLHVQYSFETNIVHNLRVEYF